MARQHPVAGSLADIEIIADEGIITECKGLNDGSDAVHVMNYKSSEPRELIIRCSGNLLKQAKKKIEIVSPEGKVRFRVEEDAIVLQDFKRYAVIVLAGA